MQYRGVVTPAKAHAIKLTRKTTSHCGRCATCMQAQLASECDTFAKLHEVAWAAHEIANAELGIPAEPFPGVDALGLR